MIKVLNMNTKNLNFIYFFQIVRPYQWVKNILVFIPMLMSHQLTVNNFILSVKAFIIFSLIASCVYVINDIVDIKSDKKHPFKKKRPLAAGLININQCKKITVGDSMITQIPTDLIASDKRNDLAILQTVSMEMASADTKSFVQRLAIQIVPIISGGLMRSEDVSGGEEILVAGYPLGNMVSDTIKVTKGIVSATRGMDNNFSLFEIDAVIRKGNSGGPIYDKRGNIVGVAVSRLNVNRTDTINFGVKGSTVKQFLSAHDIPTKWSNRDEVIGSEQLYKIASKQTVMVVCHRQK